MAIRTLAAAVALAIGTAAGAVDKEPCAAGMVCASNPESVAETLRAAGYQAKLDVDKTGDPMVSSAAQGYNFDILFYGCEAKKNCDSLQFSIVFSADDIHTADLANKWNRQWRFSQASVDDRKRFIVSYDVATIGGLTKANFADVIDWWSSTLGKLGQFWKENPSK